VTALVLLACAAPAHAAGRPDLFVTKLSSPAGTAQPGVRHTASAVVRNLGSGAAGRSSLGFYLSTDSLRSRGDIRVGGSAIKPLAPSRGARVSKSFTIPQGTPPGAYDVLVCADDGQRVRESHEGNNCLASRLRLTVGAAARASGPTTVVTVASPPTPTPEPAGTSGSQTAPTPDAGGPPPGPASVSLATPADGAFLQSAAPTFTGTGGTSSFVTVTVSSAAGAETLQTLPASDGSWSVQASPPLPDGPYTVGAQETGPLGDTASTDTHAFTVDTVDPSVAVTLSPATPNGQNGIYSSMPVVHVTPPTTPASRASPAQSTAPRRPW